MEELKQRVENSKTKIRIGKLESDLGIPQSVLSKWLKGTRELPKKYVRPLDKALTELEEGTYQSIAESIIKEAYTELTDAILEERSNGEISLKEKLIDDLVYSNEFHRDYLNSIQLPPTIKKQIIITLDTESGGLEISDASSGLSSVEIVGMLRLACLKFENEIIK